MKIAKKDLVERMIYIVLLLPFFKTDYMSKFEMINFMFSAWKIVSIIIMFSLVAKNKKFSAKLISLLVFCLWFVLITIMKEGDISTCINYFLTIIAFALFIDYTRFNDNFIYSLYFLLKVYIYINFVTMIIYPKGIYSTGSIYTGVARQNWFLGFKNIMVVYFLPGAIVSQIYMLRKPNKRLDVIVFNVIIVISTLISGSSTTITALVVWTIGFLLRKKYKVFNYKTYLYFSIVLFFVIVIFRLQNIFAFFIVGVLNKDLTFTHRTTLWDITINKFLKSPIIGYGWQKQEIRHSMYNSQTIITAHNQILEWLYMGGFIGIILYYIMLFKIDKEINKYYSNNYIMILSVGFLTLQIISLTEVYLNPMIFLPIIFMIYSSYLVDNEGKEGEKNEQNIFVNNNTNL